MSILLKKEIRLLWPSWIVALLLAGVQAMTQPYDFYVATLLYFGLTMLALTTLGRETSLNTFSSMLAQPAERIQIWKTKLTVLVAAFGSVFVVWFIAYRIASANSQLDAPNQENSRNLFITICLMATATFTGGLWTTLLMRQLASAFWLTLLVPVTLAGFSGAFLSTLENDPLVIAVMSTIIGIYSLAGFLFARWLYFRAQDVGWAGGVIVMPEWKFLFARARGAEGVRVRQPVKALLKKEFQLQGGMLSGVACMCVIHTVVVVVRVIYDFKKDSAGEVLTSVAWMLWLVLPVLIGCLSFAEERKLGMVESQLCLSASRRTQFAVKLFMTLCLGILIGGVMPACFEYLLMLIKHHNPLFGLIQGSSEMMPSAFCYELMITSAWITMVSLFASSLSKNFLQAVGIAFVMLTLLTYCTTFSPHNGIHAKDFLRIYLTVPTVVVTVTWLAYRNFTGFRDGWPLWRRTSVSLVLAIGLVNVAYATIYYRAWEAFEPVEPVHAPAKLSLASPVVLQCGLKCDRRDNLVVRFSDGRVWMDQLGEPSTSPGWQGLIAMFSNPFPRSTGPGKCISGSNWVAASTTYGVNVVSIGPETNRHNIRLPGFLEAVGIQKDGTLWFSEAVGADHWSADHWTRFGTETNWLDVCGDLRTWVILLKKDGTLWQWGPGNLDASSLPQGRNDLRTLQPRQIGTNSNWTALYSMAGCFMAKQANGSVWQVDENWKGIYTYVDQSELSQIVTQNFSVSWNMSDAGVYVGHDGTLWVYDNYLKRHGSTEHKFEKFRCNKETNWVGAARHWNWMVALKSDGTLWQWPQVNYWNHSEQFNAPPERLGIHSDWISVTATDNGIITLAADGSLWFWPDRTDYSNLPIQLPKQPKLLGNLFAEAH